jgi:hypothetical protein
MSTTNIWPARMTPDSVPVFTSNELRTSVAAESLWPILIAVADWPTWYPHAANIRTADGQPTLSLGSVFTWKTLGTRVTTEVVEFEPARAIAWSARGSLSRGFHRFDFAPTDDGGCVISTREVETGIGPRLIPGRLKRDLLRVHQIWLEELVKRASAAPAGSAG